MDSLEPVPSTSHPHVTPGKTSVEPPNNEPPSLGSHPRIKRCRIYERDGARPVAPRSVSAHVAPTQGNDGDVLSSSGAGV